MPSTIPYPLWALASSSIKHKQYSTSLLGKPFLKRKSANTCKAPHTVFGKLKGLKECLLLLKVVLKSTPGDRANPLVSTGADRPFITCWVGSPGKLGSLCTTCMFSLERLQDSLVVMMGRLFALSQALPIHKKKKNTQEKMFLYQYWVLNKCAIPFSKYRLSSLCVPGTESWQCCKENRYKFLPLGRLRSSWGRHPIIKISKLFLKLQLTEKCRS